jgi:hypothetical protein
MKRALFVGLGLMLSASCLSAQYVKPSDDSVGTAQMTVMKPGSPTTTTTIVITSSMLPCPVAMQAKQGSGGGLIAVRGKEPMLPGPSQHIHLVVTDLKKAKVTGARVRVFGLSGKSRMRDAATGPDSYDMQRTMEVTFAPEGNGETAADLYLPGFTAVNRVVLQTISYDDGSTWTPEQHQGCSVKPDLMMQVAGR